MFILVLQQSYDSTNTCKQGQLDVELNETGRQQAAEVSCICRVF